MPKRILFVFTSVDKTLKDAPTGWYLPEAAHPYFALAQKYEIDFAAPKGPNPPVDPSSVEAFKADVKFLEDATVKEKLAHAKKLSEVKASDYDAIFYVGGHGPVIDLAVDPVNIALANEFYRSGKVTAAVCHGPAALVGVTDANGNSIFKDRNATAFSDLEEAQVGKEKDIPFLPETRIKELGGRYEKAKEPWQAHVVKDGNLITGQNPASAQGVAEAIDQELSKA
ncbi:class I glutamine amidotransferase-like protein [Trametes coccinea BRFM310]|uniref:D-lactate dehydratase n=1 Tax=Trametes coccinea (strain BRFM310) TaxID=1353009 RepID=A0A1Y2ID17_TRAC3|nr:class I glutamine amidotransferase-like protein [Trametes coccinea BRFM310]